MNGKTWLLSGAVFGLLAVALGAFGAHGLEKAVTTWGLTAGEQAHRLHNWEVGVRYQMYHALALAILGILATVRPATGLNVAGIAFVLGVLIFSGCLYGYVFTGWKWFGMIVPVGGVSMIVGWFALAVGLLREASPPPGS